MPDGICNTCCNQAGLVFRNCVCRECSDALDLQFASSTATDWVLISEHSGQGLYPLSVPTILMLLEDFLKSEEKDKFKSDIGCSPPRPLRRTDRLPHMPLRVLSDVR